MKTQSECESVRPYLSCPEKLSIDWSNFHAVLRTAHCYGLWDVDFGGSDWISCCRTGHFRDRKISRIGHRQFVCRKFLQILNCRAQELSKGGFGLKITHLLRVLLVHQFSDKFKGSLLSVYLLGHLLLLLHLKRYGGDRKIF